VIETRPGKRESLTALGWTPRLLKVSVAAAVLNREQEASVTMFVSIFGRAFVYFVFKIESSLWSLDQHTPSQSDLTRAIE
jgi:hypothetical protein